MIGESIRLFEAFKALYVCLIHAPRRADRLSITTPLLFKLWNIALDLSQDSCMRDIDSSLSHDFCGSGANRI